ncbi:pilus assembly protein FlpE [Xylanimonas oleitrophica]|uniref:pilus assembly protein FlpE n=1 Tax=Xylanimonas oleitrophica TaxID=2607479 RepID=UPI0015CF9710|nr:pilus assembly protein FlpE [Xylanimonas oleitrophica]
MRTTPTPPLAAVVGACGGAGTSTVAAAVAHGLRRAWGRGVLVDLETAAAGIEVTLGIEDEPGARWPELRAARGEVDGRGLVAALPRWGSVPVLSASRLRPEAPADDVVLDVCAGLVRAGEPVVVDLPRPGAWTAAARAVVAGADDVLLVAPLTLPGAAGAVAVAGAVAQARADDVARSGEHDPRVRLVVRRPAPGRVDADDLSALTGLDVAAEVREDRALAGAVERGDGPPVGRGARLRRVGTQLAALVGGPR